MLILASNVVQRVFVTGRCTKWDEMREYSGSPPPGWVPVAISGTLLPLAVFPFREAWNIPK